MTFLLVAFLRNEDTHHYPVQCGLYCHSIRTSYLAITPFCHYTYLASDLSIAKSYPSPHSPGPGDDALYSQNTLPYSGVPPSFPPFGYSRHRHCLLDSRQRRFHIGTVPNCTSIINFSVSAIFFNSFPNSNPRRSPGGGCKISIYSCRLVSLDSFLKKYKYLIHFFHIIRSSINKRCFILLCLPS